MDLMIENESSTEGKKFLSLQIDFNKSQLKNISSNSIISEEYEKQSLEAKLLHQIEEKTINNDEQQKSSSENKSVDITAAYEKKLKALREQLQQVKEKSGRAVLLKAVNEALITMESKSDETWPSELLELRDKFTNNKNHRDLKKEHVAEIQRIKKENALIINNLQEENKHLKNKIIDLQQQLLNNANKKESILEDNSENDREEQLTENLKQIQLELHEFCNQLSSKTDELELLHVDKSTSSHINVAHDSTLDELDSESGLTLDEVSRLKNILEKHFEAEDVLLKKIKNLDKQVTNLQNQNDELKAEQDLLQQVSSEQLYQMETIRNQFEQYKHSISFAKKHATSRLENELREIIMETPKAPRVKFQDSPTPNEANNDDFEELNSLQKQLFKIEQSSPVLKNYYKTSIKENKITCLRHKNGNNEISPHDTSMAQRIKDLEKHIYHIKIELRAKNDALNRRESEILKAENELDRLQEKFGSLFENKLFYKGEYEKSKEDASKIRENLDKVVKVLKERSFQLQKLKEEIQISNRELKRSKDNEATLNKKIEEIIKSVEEKSAMIEYLESEVINESFYAKSTQIQLENEKNAAKKLRAQDTDLIRRLRIKLSEVVEERNQLTVKIKNLKNMNYARNNTLSEFQHKMKKELVALMDKLKAEQYKNQEAEDTIINLENEKIRLQSLYDTARSEIEKLTDDLNHLNSKNDELNSDLNKTKKQLEFKIEDYKLQKTICKIIINAEEERMSSRKTAIKKN